MDYRKEYYKLQDQIEELYSRINACSNLPLFIGYAEALLNEVQRLEVAQVIVWDRYNGNN